MEPRGQKRRPKVMGPDRHLPTRHLRVVALGFALATLATATGCGDATRPGSPAAFSPSPEASLDTLVDESYQGPFTADMTVLQQGTDGPKLCPAVATSYPPTCDGPPVVNWDWDEVRHSTHAGTRWGHYVLEGSYDGSTFVVTGPVEIDDEHPEGNVAEDDSRFSTPCPPPPGGWRPLDASMATDKARRQALALASTLEGHGGSWVDAAGSPLDDPRRIILNVRTTADVAETDDALRSVWGGSLCVSSAERNYAELERIHAAVDTWPEILRGAIDVVDGQVDMFVLVATTQQQAQLDELFGAGSVRLVGALVPAR